MTIKQKYIDLINAEIDGVISDRDQARLDKFVAGNEEARALRDELRSLRDDLGAIEPLAPPPDIRHAVMREIRSESTSGEHGVSDFLANVFGLPFVRYGVSFAAGVLVAVMILSSDQASRHAFNDVTDLVGTMSDIEIGGTFSRADSMDLTLNELAGTVSLNASGPLMVLDFDLASEDPVEIVATFDDRDIWFNGFAQLESQGTSVASARGSVTVRMEGQRRYAVYLHNASQGRGNGEPAIRRGRGDAPRGTAEFRGEGSVRRGRH